MKDKYVFATHNPTESPEKFSVGSVTTPHHGSVNLTSLLVIRFLDAFKFRIDVQVQSVVRYIPNSDHDDQGALGSESVSSSTFRSSGKDQSSRSQEVEAQRIDAEQRRVVWDAEESRLTDADAEGEDDPDYANDSGVAFVEPLGVKTDDGTIRPVTAEDFETANAMDVDENEQFFGKPDYEPERLGQLVRLRQVMDSTLL